MLYNYIFFIIDAPGNFFQVSGFWKDLEALIQYFLIRHPLEWSSGEGVDTLGHALLANIRPG